MMADEEPRRVLITGAGQGIGLEWARQEAEAGATVIATARDPDRSEGLRELRAARDVVVLPLDVTSDASVDAAARTVEERFGGVDTLINNAGTYGPRDDRSLTAPSDDLQRVLEVNTVGPYRVTRRFMPLVRRGQRPRILFLTSKMGSIGDGPGGGNYAYRMSKAALDMLGANLASDLRPEGVLVLLLHPGWVKTRMGGPGAHLEVERSVADLRRVVERARETQSGSFFDHAGAVVPW
jgi:NAD(P)-dependent dehydrogenase (short-subunit alcohol dehydrogenase family)